MQVNTYKKKGGTNVRTINISSCFIQRTREKKEEFGIKIK